MTFSKGKTWNLEDVRLIEVQSVSFGLLPMASTSADTSLTSHSIPCWMRI